MIFGLIVEFGCGALCIVLGLVIWLKQKISLVHEYHTRNVKKADIPAYARLMGIGLIVIGAGVCLMGLFNLLQSGLWWLPMVLGFAGGFFFFHRAQKRYNGSWFS